MRTSDFDYHLPPERIAQRPAEPRDSSRLLVLHRRHQDNRHLGSDGRPAPERNDCDAAHDNTAHDAAVYDDAVYDDGSHDAARAPTDRMPTNPVRIDQMLADQVRMEHRRFRDLAEYLRPGDLVVFNRSRVIPARLHGVETRSGAPAEILLVRRLEPGIWQALARPGRRLRPGAEVVVTPTPAPAAPAPPVLAGFALSTPAAPDPSDVPAPSGIRIAVMAVDDNGVRTVRLSDETALERLGEMPLPPYIKETPDDPERYQTVYGDAPGSVAAPTAGLHFTPASLDSIRRRGAQTAWVTLHVGLDTFRPVRGEDIDAHRIHTEWYELPSATAHALNTARRTRRRIIAVGTTTARTLEQVALDAHLAGRNAIAPASGHADLFIRPGHRFRLVDAMLTNFHLPRSTLLMLVSAFASRRQILAAYAEAIAREYRFYSFGDAMLIL